MNEKFFSLPEEKQQVIINAAMEVFGLNEYKKASTDLIASKAGISKGLLFYYFRNKRELYLFVYNRVVDVMKKMADVSGYLEIDDFFELLIFFAERKTRMLKKNPYIMELAMRAFYSEKEDVSQRLQDKNNAERDGLFDAYFSHIDTGKFRSGTDIYQVYQMLVWMTDGYLHEQRMKHRDWQLDELMAEFYKWMDMMRRLVYREEYQEEVHDGNN